MSKIKIAEQISLTISKAYYSIQNKEAFLDFVSDQLLLYYDITNQELKEQLNGSDSVEQ